MKSPDERAAELYAAWCKKLGIPPASESKYLRIHSMLEASANSLEGREVVRCSGCLLNQFMTRNGGCRRCRVRINAMAPIGETDMTIEEARPLFTPHNRFRIDLAVLILRHRLNLSARLLAERMKCPRTYVSKIENRKAVPNVSSINRFAAALEVSPRQLIEFATV